MNERTRRLRQESLDARPSVSAERALLMTAFYREHEGKLTASVLRGAAYRHLCEHQTVTIGPGELIVGERGPGPKAVPTYPELTCHSVQDLQILDSRPLTAYRVDPEVIEVYQREVIPFWRGRSMRDKIFAALPQAWMDAYAAGLFTEFMEQRAPGHTVLDDKIYHRGLLDLKTDIQAAIGGLDFVRDGEAWDKREELSGMALAIDATIRHAERHAEVAEALAAAESDPQRRSELTRIAEVCRWVPAHAPRDFWEAVQSYWFCHLGVITELNGWDAFNPGHLDQHLLPFYQQGLSSGRLSRENARELLECFFVKFNNHPAPPKVGVTAAESGTYTDFANINLGGMLADGRDGSNPVTHLLLEVIDEMHLLQPSSNLQLSRKTPDAVLHHALEVVRKGYGFPSIFNADAVVEEQLRQGKTLPDARAGGCSGCVEVGAFGKEAYILTGYFNLPKVLELALHDGFDLRTAKQLGPRTGEASSFVSFEDLFRAFEVQLGHVLEIKIGGNQIIERMYARLMPAPFLSVLIDDCIKQGRDYNAGGARYNNVFIQGVGIGTVTDSLAAIRSVVYEEKRVSMAELVESLDRDFENDQRLRQWMINRAPKYGNDDDRADDLMRRVFEAFFERVDGRPSAKGGTYRIEMLPTTCHVYFGSVLGATPDGRRAGTPVSEGISPVQGADRLGPTAVIQSAAKMDQVRTGGTLLNMKFTPALLANDDGIRKVASLVRGYFKQDGHHLQFNVVSAAELRRAQADPETHRDLIVRVAGYSDYFCDLSRALQEEIIARTEHQDFGAEAASDTAV